MSPAMLIFLPLTLLLLMSKGAGAHSPTSKTKGSESEKTKGRTEKVELIRLLSTSEGEEADTDKQYVVIKQDGQRYLLATLEQ